jgi:putative ABC transport system permease protein
MPPAGRRIVKFFPFIVANLFRKKTRTILTVGSFAVALFLFALLATIDTTFTGSVEIAGADRLIVLNKNSIIQPLPFAYRDRILQISGVKGVTYAVWFGGIYQNEKNFIPILAVDTEGFKKMYSEFAVPREQWEAFVRDREGCIVGRSTVNKYGWQIGDRVPIRGTIYPGAWEFNIRGIYDGTRAEDDTTQFWFQYNYLDERKEYYKGMVGWYVVRIATPADDVRVTAAIDERFANSAFETDTETEKSFAAGFVKQIGNIRLIIISVGTVVLFTLLLVTGSTMAMSVRERTGEFAVLKTLGFTDAAVMLLVLAESLLYAVPGALVGLTLAKLFTIRGDPTGGLLPFFYLDPDRMLMGFALAVVAGIAAGIIPALLARRLKIVEALRRV